MEMGNARFYGPGRRIFLPGRAADEKWAEVEIGKTDFVDSHGNHFYPEEPKTKNRDEIRQYSYSGAHKIHISTPSEKKRRQKTKSWK